MSDRTSQRFLCFVCNSCPTSCPAGSSWPPSSCLAWRRPSPPTTSVVPPSLCPCAAPGSSSMASSSTSNSSRPTTTLRWSTCVTARWVHYGHWKKWSVVYMGGGVIYLSLCYSPFVCENADFRGFFSNQFPCLRAASPGLPCVTLYVVLLVFICWDAVVLAY